MPSARRMRSTSASAISMPSTRTMRARRSAIGAGADRCSSNSASTTGPARPPASSSTNRVASSNAGRGSAGSTPRSKRWPASVCRPSLRPRPMIAAGAKCAASRNTCRVASVTRVVCPPIKPARATTRSPSVTARKPSSSVASRPSSSFSVSPARARRTPTGPCSVSRSKACIGWPSSSITYWVISTSSDTGRTPQRRRRSAIHSGVFAAGSRSSTTRPQ